MLWTGMGFPKRALSLRVVVEAHLSYYEGGKRRNRVCYSRILASAVLRRCRFPTGTDVVSGTSVPCFARVRWVDVAAGWIEYENSICRNGDRNSKKRVSN